MKRIIKLLFLFIAIKVMIQPVFAHGPVRFTENKGQIISAENKTRPDILYSLHDRNVNVFIGKNFIEYMFIKQNGKDKQAKEVAEWASFRLDLQNTNPNASAQGEVSFPFYENYYYAHCPKGVTKVKSYQQVMVKNIYEGIDWKIYVSDKGIKYDFIVHSGAQTGDIKLKYSHTNSLKLEPNGDLFANCGLGYIKEEAPVSYTNDGTKVMTQFYLQDNVVSFQISNYNHLKSLTIDPGIIWGTYIGGSSEEGVDGVAFGNNGNIYSVGKTISTDFAPGTYTFQGTFAAGLTDMFIAKMDSSSNLIWSSYYGGSGYEVARDIKVSRSLPERISFCGNSESTDIPLLNAFQTSNGGQTDAVVASVDDQGALILSSYYGGSQEDLIYRVAYDLNGNLYCAGGTSSPNGLMDGAGGYNLPNGAGDGFVLKLSPSGSIVWSKNYGGSGFEYLTVMDFAMPGDTLYIGGNTGSTDNISTIAGNTYQGGSDVFVMKINKDDGAVWAGSYYGGPFDEFLSDLAAPASGDPGRYLNHLAIVGNSNSTSGFLGTSVSGVGDGFNLRIDLTTLGVQWGGFFGGTGQDVLTRCRLWDAYVYFAGNTDSYSGLTTPNAYQINGSGSGEGWVGRIAWFTVAYDWLSYYGGSFYDFIYGLDIDHNGKVLIGGETWSASGIATSGTYQTFIEGIDGYLAVLAADCNHSPNMLDISSSTSSFEFCDGENIVLNASGGSSLVWTGGTVGNSLNVNSTGTYTVSGTVYGCNQSKSVTVTENPIPAVNVTPTGAQFVCQGNTMTLQANATGAASYQWMIGGIPVVGETGVSYEAGTQGSVTVEVSNAFGCTASSFPVQLFVNSPPPAQISSSLTQICQGDVAVLTANNAAVSYQWYKDGNIIPGATSSSYNVSQSGTYQVLETSPNTCDSLSNAISIDVTQYPVVSILAPGNLYTCTGNSVILSSSDVSGNALQWYLDSLPISGATGINYTANTGGEYYLSSTANGLCTTYSGTVILNPEPQSHSICICSVDSLSLFNVIVWEKPVTTSIDSFRVYREDVTGVYTYIASVDYDSLSLYTDTDTLIANPNLNTKRYKIAVVDICGLVSDYSPYHNTIYLNDQGTGTFDWNLYDVEGSITPVSQYILYRDTTLNDQWYQINQTAGTQTSMVAPNYLSYPNCRYRIESNFSFNCEPTRLLNVTRSNIKVRGSLVTGIAANNKNLFSINPNPVKDLLFVNVKKGSLKNLQLVDLAGNIVSAFENEQCSGELVKIDVSQFSAGFYSLRAVFSDQSVRVEKLIVE